MTVPNVDKIREAKTKILKETGHHSYDGRSEYLQSLIDGGLCLTADIPDRGERTMAQWAKLPFTGKMLEQFNIVVNAIKAKYPWHASPKHIKLAVLAYRARLARAKEAKASQKAKAKSKPAKRELAIAK